MRYATGRRAVLVRCLLAAVAAFILAGTAAPALADGGGGGGSGPALAGLTVSPASVAGGTSATGTVTLTAAAPAATAVALSSSNLNVAGVPASVTVAAGSASASFPVTTPVAVPASTDVTITASLGGVSVSAVLTVTGSPLAINTGGLACAGGVCALGPGNVGTFFSQAISQSGGTGPTPFTWNLIARELAAVTLRLA